MNSWSNPETIVALCGAFAALVTAVAAAWHSVNTRKLAATTNQTAQSAMSTASHAFAGVVRIAQANTPVQAAPTVAPDDSQIGHNQD
jgi:acyl-CoA synthetase (AMP-forming)/AMP-acid ligase II